MDACALNWSKVPEPQDLSHDELAVAAGLAEVLACRSGQAPPAWTERVEAATEPVMLVPSAGPRMRERLAREAPEPLRRRNVYAPADFLVQV
jgi:hypothetical protein